MCLQGAEQTCSVWSGAGVCSPSQPSAQTLPEEMSVLLLPWVLVSPGATSDMLPIHLSLCTRLCFQSSVGGQRRREEVSVQRRSSTGQAGAEVCTSRHLELTSTGWTHWTSRSIMLGIIPNNYLLTRVLENQAPSLLWEAALGGLSSCTL